MDGTSDAAGHDNDEGPVGEPDGEWVGRHMTLSRHDETSSGLVVRVRALAQQGAAADVDVAKAGAWLAAHGSVVKVVSASMSACVSACVGEHRGGFVRSAVSLIGGCVCVCGWVRAQSSGWVRACMYWHEVSERVQH